MQEVKIKQIDEKKISQYIIKYTMEDWMNIVDSDVVIVGAGPSGMTAGYYLAKAGKRVVVFERRLSFGGGIGGGAMNFHKVVIESPAEEILKEIGVRMTEVESGVFIVDTAEFMAKLGAAAVDAGVKILHGVTVDDVIFREDPLRLLESPLNGHPLRCLDFTLIHYSFLPRLYWMQLDTMQKLSPLLQESYQSLTSKYLERSQRIAR